MTLFGNRRLPYIKSIDCARPAVPGVLACGGLALVILVGPPSEAAEESTAKIAVFAFELDDRSAGGGIISQDAIDRENLRLSTDEARQMLLASGRYAVVDTADVTKDVVAAGGIQHCTVAIASLPKS